MMDVSGMQSEDMEGDGHQHIGGEHKLVLVMLRTKICQQSYCLHFNKVDSNKVNKKGLVLKNQL